MTQRPPTRTRRVVIVDESALATRIGGRLRAARQRRGLSQREVAGDRFTPQYVSSLERGSVKPSMAALNFLAGRLGVPVRDLLDQPTEPWERVTADVKLAAGDYEAAADLYEGLADRVGGGVPRAEVLLGLAEARCRLNRGAAAVSPAAESHEIFAAAERPVDAARAAYWLGSAQYQSDNPGEARALLEGLLEEVRSGLHVDAGFKLRVLTSLASVVGLSGDHRTALAYLEEGRELIRRLEPRARASYYYSLALSYKETGDLEAAMRAGLRSLALYEGIDAQLEVAALHNHLALTYLRLGNMKRAKQMARQAEEEAAQLADERALAGIVETNAQVALADGRTDEALTFAAQAIDLGERSGSAYAILGGWLTTGRAQLKAGKREEAENAFVKAAQLAREGAAIRRREVLFEVAEYFESIGNEKQALALYREAARA